MSGSVLAFGGCIACGRLFGFNPMRVPSSTAITGRREPICEGCMRRINRKRVTLGLPEFEIDVEAYEPCDERELSE